MWIGLVCFTEVGFGDSALAVRWCVDRRSNRSKVEGKLTVGFPKARWSDYREGSAVRWAWCDQSGTKSAFASQWWIGIWFEVGSVFGSWRNRRLVRRWSAFGTLVDRRLVCWSAFSLLCDRHLDRSFSSSLSLLFAEFFLSVALSLSFARVRKMFKGKNDSVKWFSGQMRQILVKRKLFSGNSIFRSCQTCGFYGKWFSETVFSQFKHSLSRKDGIY